MRDISLHLMDIIQNSVVAEANEIKIHLIANEKWLELTIEDNGTGMAEEMVDKVLDPFFTTRTTRKVGLGVPLLKEAAEISGGSLNLSSELHKGTRLTARFWIQNIDRLPLGDIAATICSNILSSKDLDFYLNLKSSKGEFSVSTVEMKQILEGVPINSPTVLEWFTQYINEGILNIFGGVLNEVIS